MGGNQIWVTVNITEGDYKGQVLVLAGHDVYCFT